MNILTFDIEEWYLQYAYFGNHADAYYKFDIYLKRILDKLDENHLKATFFCVGGMAREFPNVVKMLSNRGHEIGCHSDKHTWLNKMSQRELMEDTRIAVDSLEQLLGKKIKNYRAPAFTIGENNKYAIEVLFECGIEHDASIFPAVHAFGGFNNFNHKTPCIIKYGNATIKEFPICTTNILGKNIAYSGGGYFRFFPLWFIKKEMSKCDYNMTYFHIGDLVRSEKLDDKTFESYYKISPTCINKCMREFKNNVGVDGAFDKLLKLIDTTDFVNIEQANKMIDWEKTPIVEL